MSWTQPCCERCWIERNTTQLADNKIAIRMATRLNEPEVETCCYCGNPTIFGIYVRVDPETVPYPTREDPTE